MFASYSFICWPQAVRRYCMVLVAGFGTVMGERVVIYPLGGGYGFIYCLKGNEKMMNDFLKKIKELSSKKKADFRLQQEEVARRYDEGIDNAVDNTVADVEKYLEKQLSRFEAK